MTPNNVTPDDRTRALVHYTVMAAQAAGTLPLAYDEGWLDGYAFAIAEFERYAR